MGKNLRGTVKRLDDGTSIKVSEAVHEYLASAHVKQLEVKTQHDYHQKLEELASWCARHALVQNPQSKVWSAIPVKRDLSSIALDDITDHAIHCFLEYIRATHKPLKTGQTELSGYTLTAYVRVIKSFLNWCLLDDLYSEHMRAAAVGRIKKPKMVEPVIEAFTAEQVTALFKACDQEESEHLQLRDRAILSVLLDSGIRANELVTMTIGNVSLDAKDPHIRILGKGPKWGEVGLGEQARRALQKYIRLYREPTVAYELKQQNRNLSPSQLAQVQRQVMSKALVFVNRGGHPLTPGGLYQIIKRLGQWAGIEGVRCSPHTLRHTFSVMFMQNGGDIYRLSKLLRHTSVAVTEKYLKSLQQSEARKGARSVLDNLK